MVKAKEISARPDTRLSYLVRAREDDDDGDGLGEEEILRYCRRC